MRFLPPPPLFLPEWILFLYVGRYYIVAGGRSTYTVVPFLLLPTPLEETLRVCVYVYTYVVAAVSTTMYYYLRGERGKEKCCNHFFFDNSPSSSRERRRQEKERRRGN